MSKLLLFTFTVGPNCQTTAAGDSHLYDDRQIKRAVGKSLSLKNWFHRPVHGQISNPFQYCTYTWTIPCFILQCALHLRSDPLHNQVMFFLYRHSAAVIKCLNTSYFFLSNCTVYKWSPQIHLMQRSFMYKSNDVQHWLHQVCAIMTYGSSHLIRGSPATYTALFRSLPGQSLMVCVRSLHSLFIFNPELGTGMKKNSCNYCSKKVSAKAISHLGDKR